MIANILGLGESIKHYKPKVNEIAIGVNDVYKHFNVDYFVCVDKPHKFEDERLMAIIDNPAPLYTHLTDWWKLRNNINLIELSTGRGILKELESEKFCHSNNSTYIAVILAYKLGATEINLYGVDFNNHKHIKDNVLEQAVSHFKLLFLALKSKGIKINITNESKLYEI